MEKKNKQQIEAQKKDTKAFLDLTYTILAVCGIASYLMGNLAYLFIGFFIMTCKLVLGDTEQ